MAGSNKKRSLSGHIWHLCFGTRQRMVVTVLISIILYLLSQLYPQLAQQVGLYLLSLVLVLLGLRILLVPFWPLKKPSSH